MKKSLMITIVVSALFLAPWAQANWKTGEVQLSPFIGYGFGGDFQSTYNDYDSGTIELDNSMVWGLRLGVGLARGVGIEWQFSHMPTSFLSGGYDFFDNEPEKLNDVDLLNFQTSIMFDLGRGPVVPFVGFGIGATVFNVDRGTDKTRFSASIAGGINFRLANNLYFRTELRGYGVMMEDNDCYYDEDYYYCDNNAAYLSILEMNFGLSFRI